VSERGRPRSSERWKTADCAAAIDVRSLTPLPPAPAIPERTSCTSHESFLNDRRLDLTLTWPNGERVNVTVCTTTTRPFYGGSRTWFTCQNCGRRCAKLYAPTLRSPFACRGCWRLVYRSQYLKDSRLALIQRLLINPLKMTRSAERQRSRRFRKRLEAIPEEQLLALFESELHKQRST